MRLVRPTSAPIIRRFLVENETDGLGQVGAVNTPLVSFAVSVVVVNWR